jgi:sn-glycerol 3-phosphate transport system substrate-binding protein
MVIEEEYKGLAKFIEFMGSPEMDLYYHNMNCFSAVTNGGIELAETINNSKFESYKISWIIKNK